MSEQLCSVSRPEGERRWSIILTGDESKPKRAHLMPIHQVRDLVEEKNEWENIDAWDYMSGDVGVKHAMVATAKAGGTQFWLYWDFGQSKADHSYTGWAVEVQRVA